ncbi:MAG: cytochrome c3 family protein, partial [bacterium]
MIIKDGRLGVVSTEEVCYTCHDGAVLDSRDKTWFPNSHPVYVVPSDRIRVPKTFPLDKDGRLYCGTCHTAHGVDWGKQKNETPFQRVVFLRYENQNSFFCRQCHVAKTQMGPNHPIDKTSIKIPQEIYDLGGKTGLMTNQVICESCHKIHGAKSGYKLLIKKVDRAQLCGVCHKDKYVPPHKNYVKTFDQAARMKTHPINIKPITAKISLEIRKAGSKLGVGGTVMCLSCHKIHDANSQRRLLVKDNRGSQLCFQCHPDKKRGLLGTKHDLALSRPNAKNALGQTPKQSGPCGVCHLPHQGNAAKMWARKPSQDRDAIARLCKSCHSDGRPAANKQLGKFTHPVGRSIKNVDGETNLPLYNTVTGAKTRKKDEGAVNCGSCHDPHKWQAHSNVKPADVHEEGTQANSFLRVRNNVESTLCYECHIDKSLIEKTDHDILMMAKKHPRTHCIQILGFNEKEEMIQLPKGVLHKLLGKRDGPTGACGVCHVPHNAEYYRLWARETGDGQDVGQNLCFTCHQTNRIAEVKQPGPFMHPTGRSILNLGIEPKTKLPTYDDQLKKVKNGKIFCFSCHNIHQWNARKKAKGPGVKSEGTPSNSFLRISAADDKWAICYSCHYDKRMVAKTDHELNITVPKSKNYRGQTPAESGTCGVCHSVHNAITQARIWIRPLGPGNETMEHLCKSCHSEGRPAQAKQLGEHSHPLGRSIFGAKPDGNIPFPTFDENLRHKKNGYVTCGSCHNPHLWNVNKFEPGPGRNTEGGFENSFLRRTNDNGYKLCIVCHVDKDLIVGTDHDLSVTKPAATNWAGETVAQKGPCFQCHRVHNALADVKIWARPLGPGNDGIEKRCKSCHSPGNPAETKQIGPISHPLYANINRADGKTAFPLYDKDGNKENENGRVVCASCHNPHQWDASKHKRGPGVKTEGDQHNSFLRRRNLPEPTFCMECHSEKALVVGTDHDFRV